VTSTFAVFKAAIRVKSMHVIKSCTKTRKNRKYGNKRNFYIYPSKRSFIHKIHRFL